MSRTVVYISGPMSTGGDYVSNIRKGVTVSIALMKAGFATICQHYTGFTHFETVAWPTPAMRAEVDVDDHDFWLNNDKALVEAADVLYRMPGDSKGVEIEVAHAETIHKPIYTSLEALYAKFVSRTNREVELSLHVLQEDLKATAWYRPNGELRWANISVDGKPLPKFLAVDAPEFKPLTITDTYVSCTGGIKDSQGGRGDFSLIPYEPLRQLAEHLRIACEKKGPDGKPKYGRNNWRKGLGVGRLVSAIRRHAGQLGEENTENHLASILAEAAFAVQTIQDIKAGKLPAALDDVDGPVKAVDWKLY